jgi:hypothetical protein
MAAAPAAAQPCPAPFGFTVTAAGITPSSFDLLNDKGYTLASDIMAGNGNIGNAQAIDSTPTPTPEPAELWLLAGGLIGLFRLAAFSRRRASTLA